MSDEEAAGQTPEVEQTQVERVTEEGAENEAGIEPTLERAQVESISSRQDSGL